MNISKGQYWDKSLNFWTGCTKVSSGCGHCWALNMKKRFPTLRKGNPYPLCPTINFLATLEKIHYGQLVLSKEPAVYALQWLGDLWHPEISPFIRAKIFDFLATYPQHTFLALTKRPEYIYFDSIDIPQNMYIGFSAENQESFDKRASYMARHLIDNELIRHNNWMDRSPFPRTWISLEPLLDQIDLSNYKGIISQIIVGGETGHGARPMKKEWVIEIRDYCEQYNIPFFLKYLNKKDGRILDGRTHDDLIWRPNGV